MRLLFVMPALVAGTSAFAQIQVPQASPPPNQVSASPIRATKTSDSGGLDFKPYATVEMRHHINTFYDDQGFYERQEPSLHARFQLGARFYGGVVDTYATLGAYKFSGTQQVLQRRPEVGVDVRPLKHENFEILQYSLFQLPYRETLPDPETQEGGEMGTVILIGLAPTAKLPLSGAGARWEVKAGGDAWTRLFSRRQYTDDYRADGRSYGEDEEGRLFLTDGTEQEPVEDTNLHYRSLWTIGGTVSPNALPEIVSEVSANHFTRFDPRYDVADDGSVSSEYGAERYSYLRWRLQFQLSERWSMTNELYAFYDGAFADKRSGALDRRYRNVARVTCRL